MPAMRSPKRFISAFSILVLGVWSLSLVGCSEENQVTPEEQAAGRKAKGDFLNNLAPGSPKKGTGKSSKSKAQSALPDNDI